MDYNNYSYVLTCVKQFGAFAPLVLYLLFVAQAMLPVFPYVVLAAAGGFLFGFQQGVLLAWSGALTGASLAYWIFRWFGTGNFLNKYYTRYGYDARKLSPGTAFWTIIIARVIPVVPTPLINMGAALGRVPFPAFLLASALGKIPSAVLYTGLGLALFQARDTETILFITAAGLTVLILARVAAKQWHRQKIN
ncbi:MAG: TVP38/TMEM64 family inner membrane protein YdjZ [Firmicutes bacterium ADurb.Bin456]|nr:MAG: TVP38/TMEM64 family inner membrane protein YdjZ [Firmicutes bacterium ADurb.Bin456]